MNVYCRDLGQMDYKACWDLQQTLFDALTAGKTNRTAAPESATPSSEQAGTILLVEHPPVYTLGKSGHAENLLVGRNPIREALKSGAPLEKLLVATSPSTDPDSWSAIRFWTSKG